MFRSESMTSNLLMEVDSLNYRLKNIKQMYCNTSHNGLRARLIYENQNIFRRINEIFSIAKQLERRKNEKISFSSLLLEKCTRTISETKIELNLFFL